MIARVDYVCMYDSMDCVTYIEAIRCDCPGGLYMYDSMDCVT